jgi:uncharacterized membrane protein
MNYQILSILVTVLKLMFLYTISHLAKGKSFHRSNSINMIAVAFGIILFSQELLHGRMLSMYLFIS